MDTKFKYPIPCKVVGMSPLVPEGWPGRVVGLAYAANEDGFGVCVEFEKSPPGASLMKIWMLGLENVETENGQQD